MNVAARKTVFRSRDGQINFPIIHQKDSNFLPINLIIPINIHYASTTYARNSTLRSQSADHLIIPHSGILCISARAVATGRNDTALSSQYDSRDIEIVLTPAFSNAASSISREGVGVPLCFFPAGTPFRPSFHDCNRAPLHAYANLFWLCVRVRSMLCPAASIRLHARDCAYIYRSTGFSRLLSVQRRGS